MVDTYQAVYDAVRSKISGVDIGAVASEVMRQSFDISWIVEHVKQEMIASAQMLALPHVLMRPRLFIDQELWCALYGENLQDGVAGFGDSPAAACMAFDKAWHQKRGGENG